MLISLKFSISFHCGKECGLCVHLEYLMFSILCFLERTVLLTAVMMIREASSDSSNGTDTTKTKGRLTVTTASWCYWKVLESGMSAILASGKRNDWSNNDILNNNGTYIGVLPSKTQLNISTQWYNYNINSWLGQHVSAASRPSSGQYRW